MKAPFSIKNEDKRNNWDRRFNVTGICAITGKTETILNCRYSYGFRTKKGQFFTAKGGWPVLSSSILSSVIGYKEVKPC